MVQVCFVILGLLILTVNILGEPSTMKFIGKGEKIELEVGSIKAESE